jgi:hypothetical protein
LPAAAACAFPAADLAATSRRGCAVTAATTARRTAAARRLGSPHDVLRGAHVLNVWKLPDPQLARNSSQIDRSIRKAGSRLTQQRIWSASAAASAASLPGGRFIALLLRNERNHCGGEQEHDSNCKN